MTASTNLILHAQGTARGRIVGYDELAAVPTPPATASWYPVPHAEVLDTVRSAMTAAGYVERKVQLALNRDNARFFATLDLETPLGGGTSLAVGIRNSIDKTFPLGFAAGSRVFICDNLAFSAELLVKSRHTRFGQDRFAAAIGNSVNRLAGFAEAERGRIEWMQNATLTDGAAHDHIIGLLDRRIITATLLPAVLREYREPRHEEFAPRTNWSLFNAVTEILRDRAVRDPMRFTGATMRLNELLGPPLAALDGPVIDATFEAN